jgi:hypothetical protein
MSRFALFYQSLVSDWNHGNAHFLRGIMRALQARGHSTTCYEQADNWSLSNLLSVNPRAVAQFREAFPDLAFEAYQRDDAERFLRQRLAHADVAIVNEWNEPDVVRLIGRLCRELGVTALFHDTHYRVVLDADYRGRLVSSSSAISWRSARRWQSATAPWVLSTCRCCTKRPRARLSPSPVSDDLRDRIPGRTSRC